MADDKKDAVNGQLRMAAQRGNISLMQEVLTTHKNLVDINNRDGMGNAPLHYSAQAGHMRT